MIPFVLSARSYDDFQFVVLLLFLRGYTAPPGFSGSVPIFCGLFGILEITYGVLHGAVARPGAVVNLVHVGIQDVVESLANHQPLDLFPDFLHIVLHRVSPSFLWGFPLDLIPL